MWAGLVCELFFRELLFAVAPFAVFFDVERDFDFLGISK
jgi:hypothetical protein